MSESLAGPNVSGREATATNDWEAYKEKWGPTLDEQEEMAREHGTISAIERTPQNLWGLGDALTQSKALLTGAHTPIESGLETPTFLEPIKDWMSKAPLGGTFAAGLIPGTRGEVVGETIPALAFMGAGAALQPGGVAGQAGGLIRGGSHPSYVERIKNVAKGAVDDIFPSRPPARLPSPAGGAGRARPMEIPQWPEPSVARVLTNPGRPRAVPKAEQGSWTRAGEDVLQDWSRSQSPNTTNSIMQEIKRAGYNQIASPIMQYLGLNPEEGI